MQSVFALGWCGNNDVSLRLPKHTAANAELAARLFVRQQNRVKKLELWGQKLKAKLKVALRSDNRSTEPL